MNIQIFEVEPWEKDTFGSLEEEHDIQFHPTPVTVENAEKYSNADIVSVFIYSQLSGETLSRMPNLKMIATRSTGYDHIDTDYCRSRGITVCNVPSYGTHTVAEHVFGLLLTISHRIPEAIDRTRRGDFSIQGLRGFDLHGKTIGIIGTGGIGRNVIAVAKGFSMRRLAYDVNPDSDFSGREGFEYADFDTLLRESDIITVHVPGTRETHHLLSEHEFSLMKNGVVIINTARGNVINVTALIHALAEGKVAAAGLDVLPEEPLIREEAELLRSIYQEKHDMRTLLANHVLLRLRNVYITPHNAFNTREAVQRILNTTLENIEGFLSGKFANIVEMDVSLK